MAFIQSQLIFQPGIFSNRSPRASQQRWVDAEFVRFRDGVPEQMGGWQTASVRGDPISGVARDAIAFKLNSQLGRYAGIGTHLGYFILNGSDVDNVTPVGFVAGRVDTIQGVGYGVGPYGAGPYGRARSIGTTLLDAGVWTSDMFGQILLACFNGDGKIYKYDIEGGDAALEEIVGTTGRAICVSDERHLFVFGMNGDPTFVGWSDREDFTEFDPLAAGSRAGGYTVQATSAFQCGRRVRGYVLGWTQTEVFGFYPLNNSVVYGRERLGTNCGACGPQAVAIVTDSNSEIAVWMGLSNFYKFEGSVQEMPCELRDYVFGDINFNQRAKFQARTNAQFSEILFFYVSAAATEIDRCVVYCYANNTWSKAPMPRTTWLDRGIFNTPIGITATGAMYLHETGDTADGEVLPSFVRSHPITIGVGQQFAELDQFWPDMQVGSAGCAVTFLTRDFPGDSDAFHGPYEFAITDEKVDLAISCRQFQVQIAGQGGYWELGVPSISMQGGALR